MDKQKYDDKFSMTNNQLNIHVLGRETELPKRHLSKFCILLFVAHCFLFMVVNAQTPVIPKAKTREAKKAERKGMTLEQKIESMAPVDITLPSASLNLPGNNKVSNVEDAKKFVSETLPDIGLKVKRQAKDAKALAKQAVAVFDGKKYDGVAVEKQIIRRGSGSRMRYTELYTSKKNDQQPNPYVRSIFWFEPKRQRVVEALARNREQNLLLHGPYKEFRGEDLIEEGYYYLGTRHGRWVTYGTDGTILSKSTYSKGFLANSVITYYDADSTKIREIIPNWYGKQTGDYFIFHEGGTLAVQGQLDNGVKVGKWIEYYPTGNRRKKETQYGGNCFDTTAAYVIREYDESGKLTYQKQ